jgi:protein tyrosine phosphatase
MTAAETNAAAAATDAPYILQCSSTTSGQTCLAGPCTLGLCAQSYCVPLAFIEDDTPCGNGVGVCKAGECGSSGSTDPAATTAQTTTKTYFDSNALSNVPGYDDPGAIRILGSVSLQGVTLSQVEKSPTLQSAISFSLEAVTHETLLPDPAVNLVKVVLSGAHESDGLLHVDFSVVKFFGSVNQMSNIIEALGSAENAAYFFSQQVAAVTLGASVTSASVLSSSMVPLPEIATTVGPRNTTMQPQTEPEPSNGTSAGLVILACTFTFLIVAVGVLFWRFKNVGRDSFDVLPRKPVVPIDEYVPQDSYITVKNRGAYLRSEPLATADNFVSARHPLNKTKNRSEDHLPYDTSRVTLFEAEQSPVPCSDYINASMVEGYGNRKYIASQSPLQNTVVDFWRMITEQSCNTVVCMTRGEEGSAQQTAEYWPEQKDVPVTFGPFTITLAEVAKNAEADAVVRKLVVNIAETQDANDAFVLEPKYLGTSINVTMWQYLGFAEKFTPVDPASMIEFRNAVRAEVGDDKKPVIVHCNNGCGRTGVFIVLDIEMDRFSKENQVDLYERVVAVRRSRPQLVETKQQYVFLHRAFIYQLLNGPNHVLAADLPGKQKDFLKNVTVSPSVLQDMPSFDIGLPGRKMLHMGDMVLSAESMMHPVVLVIMSDLVVLCQVDGNEQVVIAVGRRDSVVVKKDVKGSSSSDDMLLFFRIKIGDDVCTLKVESAEEKSTWIERLLDDKTGFTEPVLNGERLVAKKPQFRRDALALMQCPDPQSKEGSDEIKSEFGTIPLVFHAGPRSPVKAISGGKPRAIYMRSPASASALSPQANLRTNNFFSSAASPAGGHAEESAANPSVLFGGSQSPGGSPGKAAPPQLGYRTNASVRAMPGLMLRATETVLAAKLGELESAIVEATRLEYIANGGRVSPQREQQQLFLDLEDGPTETATELAAVRESYIGEDYNLEGDRPESPHRPASPARSASPSRLPNRRLSGLWKKAGSKVVKRSAAAERFARGIKPAAGPPHSDFAVVPSRRQRKKVEATEEKKSSFIEQTECTHLGNCRCPTCEE